MGNELTYIGSSELVQQRDPAETMAEIQKAAVVLKGWIQKKQKPVIFNGEQYLEREDWGLIGMFWGCTAKPLSSKYVEFEIDGKTVHGFEAEAVVITKSGMEIGRAESLCLDNEDNWGEVPKYEWIERLDGNGKKIYDQSLFGGKGGYVKDKTQVGTTPKPLFQLKSMAQTRAEAKALKSVFSFVAVLAGFAATPAEEMTGNETVQQQESENQKRTAPQPEVMKKSERTQATQKQESGNGSTGGSTWTTTNGHDPKVHITEKQNKFLYVVMKKMDISDKELHIIMKNAFKIEHRNLIPMSKFPDLLDAIDPEFTAHEMPKNKPKQAQDSSEVQDEDIPF